jgi:type I restriction enzyme, S subunit
MTDEAIFEQEEISDLPDNWVWTTISEICEVNPTIRWQDNFTDDMPITFVPMAAVDEFSGTIANPEIRPISEVWTGYKRFSEGDVIFARITPSMENGKAAIAIGLVNGLATGSTEFHVLHPPEIDELREIIAKWLYHFIRQEQFRGDAAHKMTGTAGQLRVPADFMSSSLIPLAPLNEQRRIVEEIEAQFTRLDAGIAALKRLEANLKRYKASVLKAACEGDLVPQDPDDEPAAELLTRILRERREQWEADKLAEYEAKGKKPPKGWQDKYKAPVEPDTDDLPDLPEGWVWTSLDALADVRSGITKGRHLEKYETLEIPYLRVANVQDGYLDLEEIKEITVKASELDKYRLEIGDILFNEGGDRDKLGRGAIWQGELEYCGHQNHVYSARRFSNEIAAEWIDIARRVDHARDYFWRVASQSVNLASINMTKLRYLPVPISPRSEQYRILDEIDKHASIIEEIINEVQTNLIRAERLRQSILKEAFAGRLVPQDPSDEPASELLARIHAEREKKS